MIKKFLVVLLTLVLCLFVAGCGSDQKISLEDKEIKLYVGETYEINPIVVGVSGEDLIDYTVKDSELLSIEGNIITALTVGETSVEVSLKDNAKVKAILKVTIEDVPVITITGENSVLVGEEIQLEVTLTGIEGTIEWSVDDAEIASIENGKLKGLKKGEVVVTATCGNYEGTYMVQVKGIPEFTISGKNVVPLGKTIKLNVAGVNIEDGITWTSSDESIATVENGVVTGVKEGTVTITATCGKVSKTIEVEVANTYIEITGPSEMYLGEEVTLSANVVNGTTPAASKIEWSCSEDDVATVTAGKVTPKQTGSVIIYAEYDGMKAEHHVEIVLKKEVIILGDKEVDLNDFIELSVSLVNVNGTATWSSSDETVATVVDGVVTGKKLGKAIITAEVDGIKGTFEIEVIAVIDKVTYYFEGGACDDIYIQNKKATINVNGISNFWGAYATNIFLFAKGSKDLVNATFSDRISIGKDEYTGYWKVLDICSSGTASWPTGTEWIIVISSSYNKFNEEHDKVLKINVGDYVFFEKDPASVSNTVASNVYFSDTEVAANKLVIEKANYSGNLITPVKLGYEFLGWYDSYGTQIQSLAQSQISGNVKLTAKWNELNPVTGINVSGVPSEMETDGSAKITATVTPSDAFFKEVFFTSSDKDIVSVDENGSLKALNAGKATITITDLMGKVVKTYEITVNSIPSIDISFAGDYNGVLEVGQKLQLEPTYLGKAVDNLSYTYVSNDTAIATVDASGEIKAIANGTVEITITSSNGKTLVVGITIYSLSDADKVEQVIKLLVENNFAEVEVGNACLYNDGTNRYYKATYGSVNRYLFTPLDIKQDYVAQAEANSGGHKTRRFENGFNDSIEFVTVHDTATLSGTTAAIANNMSSGKTSIHYAVGNNEIYAVVPEKYIAYHAGDGTGTPFKWLATGVTTTENVAPEYDITKVNGTWYFVLNGQKTNLVCPISNGSKTITNPSKAHLSNLGPVWKVVDGQYYIGNTWVCFSQVAAGVIGSYGGNNNSIGIEMSVNTTNDMYDTYQRTAKLVADICIRNNLDTTRVKQHNTWTGKNCPQSIIAGNYWDDFMKMVDLEYTIAKDYNDVTIEMVSNNPSIVDNTGRVINAPSVATTVSYTVTVTCGSETKSITLYSVVPGTTSWLKWNGTYKSSYIWNNGDFVVNK